MFKKLVSLVIAASVFASLGITSLADGIKIGEASRKLTVPANLYADYSSIELVSVRGNPITISVAGTNMSVSSTCISSGTILVKDFEHYNTVTRFNLSGNSGSSEIASQLQVNALYMVLASYTADGKNQEIGEIYITKKSDGNLSFVESPIYDFNVERCSELWTDEASLQECLVPQNDVECDDPAVIAEAERITAGCTTDWEKAYAIYDYIVGEFAYDYVQISDASMVYQDDALTLIRRKVAICEGMGNTFTALCRAAGVPAAVSFGIGMNADDALDEDMLTDEGPNHAWACVCLGGKWYHVDPTWDCENAFDGSSFETGSVTMAGGPTTCNWFLLPVEIFSWTHKICDADTTHGIESSGSCGSSATYTISRDGTCTISGSGEVVMPYGVNGFSRVIFDDDCTVTSIGEEAFIDCDIITTVILPDTLRRIEDRAFNTCEDLEYVYFPDGLEFIGQEAFDYCDELAYVYIPDSVTTIERWAFDDCSRLIISIPERLSGFNEGNYVDPLLIVEREGA
ncbi:MAG: leucine-rich repeat protein [Clostridiales bacterium]|nr:leucine-rich repeat protein [Clostridiales bacterium]